MEFHSAQPKSINLKGDLITVRKMGTKVEAVRTNYRTKTQRVGALERLVLAVEAVTGCIVNTKSIRGDDVLIRASVKCNE